MLLFVAVCLSVCRGGTSSDRQSVWKCRLLEVEGGYGYAILHGHDTLIRQSWGKVCCAPPNANSDQPSFFNPLAPSILEYEPKRFVYIRVLDVAFQLI